ncbi:MAG: hypothetical protein J6Z36_02940, partial [Clostridia bacterium]|nr:hypothetical protein [Clostridia bacterium]
KIYYALLKNGVVRSSMLDTEYAKAEAEYQTSFADVLDDMIFRLGYLQANGQGGANTDYSYPSNPDYSLSVTERYYVVRDYYMQMSDPNVRFALFQTDPIAHDYLGQFYATLYDRLRNYTT